MGIAQSDFNLWRSVAFEGQVSTIDLAQVLSRQVEGAFIAFGRAVVRGIEKRSCAPVSATSTAADIIGFTVRTMAQASPTPPTNTSEYAIGYPVNDVASVLRKGPMYALCVDGAIAGDQVVVITTPGENLGRLTADATGIKLDYVKWIEDVAAGKIGEIMVDGILAKAP